GVNPLLLIPALLAGVAVALFAWGLRGWITRRFADDVVWMRETHLRFNPEPVNARLHVILYYLSYLFFLGLLLAIIQNLVVVAMRWVGSWWLPRLVISWLWRRRLQKIDAQIAQSVCTLA